jgi:hypothetical protein
MEGGRDIHGERMKYQERKLDKKEIEQKGGNNIKEEGKV